MKRIFVIAALATLATAAQAQNNNANNSNNAAASTTTAAPAANVAAAGQTATTLPDPEAAATKGKAWSVSIMNQTSVDASVLNYSNNNQKSYGSVNYVGAGYKVDAKNKIGARQYFGIDHDGETNKNKTTMMDAVLTYSRSGWDGILKSDPLSATFWYYAPTSDASRDVNSNGMVRMDMEIGWTLNPKWSVSYYLNPRQSFIPEGEVVVDGKASPVFSKTTLIHYGYLYYNVSDAAQAYTYAGYMHRWNTSSLTLHEEHVLAGLGASFSLLGGKVNLNPEISVDSKTVAGYKPTKAEEVFQEKNVSYVLTSAFVF
ncbi:hypothetical protein [Bdellovibrio sp. HCB337]|uniref:hypothetical protein n=1 Tax=Bdellovibrio sp. HCB337 TaxID=3394358 RepID=UPI0039A54171